MDTRRRDSGFPAHPPSPARYAACSGAGDACLCEERKESRCCYPCHKRVRPRDSLHRRAPLTCQPATPASTHRRCMCATANPIARTCGSVILCGGSIVWAVDGSRETRILLGGIELCCHAWITRDSAKGRGAVQHERGGCRLQGNQEDVAGVLCLESSPFC
jgi:hypothetical protein